MATTHCYVPILGRKIRVTQLNSDGSFGTQEIITDGFIEVVLTASIEAGTEILQRNAAGILCVNELLASNFKRFMVDIKFCNVNPSLLSFVTNVQAYNDWAGQTAGFTQQDGIISGFFGLELWTGLGGVINEQTANGYFLLPFVHVGNLDTITVNGTAGATFALKNAYTLSGNQWGTGQHKVVASTDSPAGVSSKLPVAVPVNNHLLVMDTAIASPPAACSPQTIIPNT